jgi:hypothetical protein
MIASRNPLGQGKKRGGSGFFKPTRTLKAEDDGDRPGEFYKHKQTHLLKTFKRTTQGLTELDDEYLTIEFVFHHSFSSCFVKSDLYRSFQYHLPDCRPGFPSFPMLTRKI